MSFMFGCFVLFLGFQLGSIESAPTQCECELMPLCELEKAYEELRCFAESFLNADIKNKVLEFLQRFQAVPKEKITRKRFCEAAPLVRTALAALKDDCLCVKDKLEGVDALMNLIGLVPTACINEEIATKIWDDWISGITYYLKQNNPVTSLISVK